MASCTSYLKALAYLSLLLFFIPIRYSNSDENHKKFEEYLETFNKTYDDPDLYQKHLSAFRNSLEIIERLNSNRSNTSAVFGLTRFSDLTPEEFHNNHLQTNFSRRLRVRVKYHHRRAVLQGLPKKLDWRQKNVVTKLKNQGECGACWAFSAVELLESMSAIKSGNLQELSVQQIVDCAGYENKGCDGGDVCSLLQWLTDFTVKVQKETEYPLKYKTGPCKLNFTSSGVIINEFVCENFVKSEDGILELLANNGPVAAAINAQVWQNYIGGVVEYHCDGAFEKLNHAVQIVGYDLSAPIPFYIVRNTWGENFGDGGYLYLAIGKNMCGVANEVSALTVL